MADVEALRTLRAEGVPALLSGPPGTGKTSLVEAAFPDLITMAGDGEAAEGLPDAGDAFSVPGDGGGPPPGRPAEGLEVGLCQLPDQPSFPGSQALRSSRRGEWSR
jgi:hypothetical protein